MELRHLRYFITVASAGGFSGAATRLGVTQPALSRQVHDLERELGVRLFERHGRRVRLTAEGEDLERRSRDVLAAVERLGEQARALRGGEAGLLRVGASPQVIQNLLAPFLARYLRSRSGIEVHLVEEGALRLPGLLERGDVHIALGLRRGGDELAGRPLHPVRTLAVMLATHRLGRRATVDISDLASRSCC
jgi:DNA-binding transcriptional LysR family regulator